VRRVLASGRKHLRGQNEHCFRNGREVIGRQLGCLHHPSTVLSALLTFLYTYSSTAMCLQPALPVERTCMTLSPLRQYDVHLRTRISASHPYGTIHRPVLSFGAAAVAASSCPARCSIPDLANAPKGREALLRPNGHVHATVCEPQAIGDEGAAGMSSTSPTSFTLMPDSTLHEEVHINSRTSASSSFTATTS
jgi:hypothetical protein